MPRDGYRHSHSAGSEHRPKILFICGSLNQTTQMHQIAAALPECDAYYTPYYADGFIEGLRKRGMAEFTILGGKHFARTVEYLRDQQFDIDYRGERFEYDLVVRCADLVVPRNTRGARSILVQEGMTDPRNLRFYLIKYFGLLPRWAASTATFGLSDEYDRFCVASDGYREHFIENGILAEKLTVTGIPNFDNCARFLRNDFPHSGYVLVCTSDMRETLRYENRPKFIQKCVEIAAGRQLIFKLHPNENAARATTEINTFAPGALVYATGKAEEMVANCDVLVTRYSTVIFYAAALGKEIHCDLDHAEIKALTPLQNGRAALNIAEVCRDVLSQDTNTLPRGNAKILRKHARKNDIRQLLGSDKRRSFRYGI